MFPKKAALSPLQPLTHDHNIHSIEEKFVRMKGDTEENYIQEVQMMSKERDATECNACWERICGELQVSIKHGSHPVSMTYCNEINYQQHTHNASNLKILPTSFFLYTLLIVLSQTHQFLQNTVTGTIWFPSELPQSFLLTFFSTF